MDPSKFTSTPEKTNQEIFTFPISLAQRRMWFLDQLVPGNPAYTITLALKIEGPLSLREFERALNEIIARHESLRTTFGWQDGGPIQIVAPGWHCELPITDMSEMGAAARESSLEVLVAEEQKRPFDLEHGPLLRVSIIKLAAEEYVLLLSMHHIISDGWSMQVYLRELCTLYEDFTQGRSASLSPLPIQFADFALWQQEVMGTDALAKHLSYWREQLKGLEPLQLRTDRPRPAIQSSRGARIEFSLSSALSNKLRQLGQREQVTPFMTLLAAYMVLLHRYSQQEDIIVGSPIANRDRTETAGLIGFFASTLVLRGDLSGNPTFRDLLQRIRKTTLEAYEHQDVSFERLVEVLHPERDISRNPLFQVSFALENDFSEEVHLSGLHLSPFSAASATTRVDLETCMVDAREGFSGWMIYNTDLFDASTVARMADHYTTLLKSILEMPEKPLSEFHIMQETEWNKILRQSCGPTLLFPRTQCFHELFEEQVANRPEVSAAWFEGQQMTYAELNRRANQVAHFLRGFGVAPDVPVGICLERSLDMLVSVLGVLKAGGCYVPLDPTYPAERLAFLLRDSNVPVLLTTSQLLPAVPFSDAQKICLDMQQGQIARQAEHNPQSGVSAGNLAYIIYTSGSTGPPKGTLVEHRGLRNVAEAQATLFGLSPADRVLQFASLSFDASIFEIAMAVRAGGTLCMARSSSLLPGPNLAKVLRDARVTIVTLPPSVLAAMPPEQFLDLRLITVAGETCAAEVVERWGRGRQFFNLYGPTETTIWATAAECSVGNGRPSIGRPIANTRVYLLDEHRQLVPAGVPGEIYIGGVGVARGYLNRPELTRERFTNDPFVGEGDARLYHTGDRACWRPDGSIDFLGRADRQIKIRGFRIEPGEIEDILRKHPLVSESVVISREEVPGDKQLVAYVAHARPSAPTASEIREFLRQRVPEHMVPTRIVVLESLPMTPSGKVDHRALPVPTYAVNAPEEPSTDLECKIAAICKELLGVPRIGRAENFFDLGGHSLLLAKMHQRLQTELGRVLAIVDLFKYPTVEALAAFLSRSGEASSALIPPPNAPALHREPIAIIAMAARFPGASTVEEFWRNLREGVESIRSFSVDELIEAGVEPELLEDPRYVKSGSVLENIEEFDAKFFGVSPREAQILDPQHRVFLECSHEALERAGCDPQRYKGRIGVFAGARMSSYLLNNLYGNPTMRDASAIVAHTGNNTDSLPARVAYKLNLRGPAVNVQTTCSTSLVAVHLACQSLLQGDCDLALAGGAGISLPQGQGYCYEEEGILSPDGHCRAFDAKAQGTILGNGVALVVLKRLSDAEASGDNILAIIKGSAINNDGAQKVGFTAPSITGQADVIAAAQAAAGVKPDTITYIESHGTGTLLGDPIEIAALTEAFQMQDTAKQYCALGSVKTNLGHLDAAAGVAGLIKTVLQLQHKELVPSLHFVEPNPKIDFENSPFYVNARLREWQVPPDVPRRAGVSSFGIGGTNAHVIVEEAPVRAHSREARPWQLLTVSAKTASSLERAKKNLAHYLKSHGDAHLPDVAYTQMVGRTAYPQRWAMLCNTREEAIAGLEEGGKRGRVYLGEEPRSGRPTVFMFPGQGSQYVHMGRELYESEPCFRTAVDNCSEELAPHLGLDPRTILYPADEQAIARAEQQLRETWITQPALFVVEYALAQLWASWGVRPQAMIGHSLGEYVAATIARVFTLNDALRLVAARGRLMQSIEGGAMLAVPMTESELAPQLSSKLSLAAVNAPDQCVVSGPTEAISEFRMTLAARKIETRLLHTSHAFHSAMMDSILQEFRGLVRQAQPGSPTLPFLSNRTGTWITPELAASPDYWVDHLRQTVRFGGCVAELLSENNRAFIEVGPGNALAGLVRRQLPSRVKVPIVGSLRHPSEKIGDTEYLARSLAELWIAGAFAEMEALFAGQNRRRLVLPTYPFERQRYWVEPPSKGTSIQTKLSKKLDLAEWFYVPSWQRTTTLPWKESRTPTASRCLIFVDDSRFAQAFAARTSKQGHDVVTVYASDAFAKLDDHCFSIRASERKDYDALLRVLREKSWTPTWIFHLWLTSTTAGRSDWLSLGFHSLLFLAQGLETEFTGTAMSISIFTAGLSNVLGQETICADKATVLGSSTVIPQEYPHLRCRVIDVESSENGAAENAVVEGLADSEEPLVAHRRGYRWVQDFKSVRLPLFDGVPPQLRHRGVYLLTGGMGGMGLEMAKYLGETVQARLILVGRTALPARSEWERLIQSDDTELSERLQKLIELETRGIEYLTLAADVSSADELALAIRTAHDRFGPINGVIHAAGLPGGTMISRETPETSAQILAAKVQGTKALHETFRDSDLDFFLLCSSQRSIVGGPGQASYCAANAFLDAFAEAHSHTRHPWICSVVWDTWEEVGMAARLRKAQGKDVDAELFRNSSLLNREALTALERILARPLPVVVVSTEDFSARREHYRRTTITELLAEAEKQQETKAHARPELRTTYIAPRNRAESALASIWQRLLGIEKVGVEDNFFELGGDSVISLQVVSQARQAGLQLPPKQVFEHQTITELAAIVDRYEPNTAEQGLVTGSLPLTPIERWFFDQHFADPHHYNQSLMLELRRRVAACDLRQIFVGLLRHHDALRMRYEQNDGLWRQWCADEQDEVPFTVEDFSKVVDADLPETITAAADKAQASLRLTEGPLLRLVLFDCGGHRAQRLLLVIHHLVVDVVSWRVLLEDLDSALRHLAEGRAVRLPEKTTSFQQWAEYLTDQVARGAFDAELEYWQSEGAKSIRPLPTDSVVERTEETEATIRTVQRSLTSRETWSLLQEMPSVYNSQITDALLTALVETIGMSTGERRARIDLEGLGRETSAVQIDLSRTVGWFTALYPVVIETEGATRLEEALSMVKQQLRKIPNHGVGYGALRYMSAEGQRLADLPHGEISFLYLGQNARGNRMESNFVEARESSGRPRTLRTPLAHRLALIVAIVDDTLEVTWMYSWKTYRQETLERIADRYISSLRDLLDTCRRASRSAWARESSKLFHWPSAQIDRILSAIERSSDLASSDQLESVSPLSPMQAGMLFHSLLSPEAAEYSKRACCVLEGQLHVENFRLAWQQLADRHAVLRTAFVWQGTDFPVQVVCRSVKLSWDLRDWSSLATSQQEEELNRYLEKEGAREFQLSRAPLMRFALLCMARDRYVFVWSFHHILLDGWSIARILQEVFVRYDAAGKGNPVTVEPELSYQQFVAWLHQQDADKAEAFWRNYLHGVEFPTPLVVDRPPARNDVPRYKEIRVEVRADTTAKLQALAQSQHVTVNTVLQGAWAIMLSRYSRQAEALFGATVAGRPASLPGAESAIGLFINTLPVRVRVNASMPLGHWLVALQAEQSEARQYEWTSLVDIHKWSGLPATQQLFESLFVFENYPTAGLSQRVAGVDLRFIEPSERTSFPLTIVAGLTSRLSLTFVYDAIRFDDASIQRMAGHYSTLLENMSALPHSQIRAIPLLPPAEMDEITVKWNDTATDWATPALIPQLIDEQAARTPDLPAVKFRDRQLTYLELNRRTNQLANYLRARGFGRGTLVGVCMERSIEMVLALVAVVKAGAAYVPLDSGYPSERLRFMMADADSPLLLTEQHLLDRLPNTNAQVLALDSAWDEIARASEESPNVEISPDDLVYVIYTSGSTGQPKGAMNTHDGLRNRLLWMQREYELTSDDRVMQKTPFSFDVSVWEFFWPLMTGACLIVAVPGGHRDPGYLMELIAREKVTTLHFVPSMLRAFLSNADPGRCRSLKRVICSGEALRGDLQHEFFAKFECELHNLYGPTEASIDVTYWRCTREDCAASVPIGRPIANTQIYILDQDLNPVPVGVPGELHIGGTSLARGYWRRAELTREKFIPNPFSAVPGARLYKSGDLARYRPDGAIEYLARMDDQIKIRGQRVELGEIEATLKDYRGVRETVAILREHPSGESHLIAYVVAHGQADLSVAGLSRFLKERLPEYMVPSAFVFLEAMPLSPNGKLDRGALPVPEQTRPTLENQYVEPRSAEEIVLARIWTSVLEVDKVGVQDNFFELGGHSLLALQMLSRVREMFEIDLPLRALFEAPTIAQLRDTILRLEQTPGRVQKIAQVFLAVSDMSEQEISEVLQQKSASAG